MLSKLSLLLFLGLTTQIIASEWEIKPSDQAIEAHLARVEEQRTLAMEHEKEQRVQKGKERKERQALVTTAVILGEEKYRQARATQKNVNEREEKCVIL